MTFTGTSEIARNQMLTAAMVATCAVSTASMANAQVRFESVAAKEVAAQKRTGVRMLRSTTETSLDNFVLTFEDATSTAIFSERTRETTDKERALGELRRWRSMPADWDGEGSVAPVASSVKAASNFLRALDDVQLSPEPMLHSSGLAGLFWKTDSLYADLEFLGDGRVAYYIEKNRGRHKGVLEFDGMALPPVFRVFLEA